MKVRFYKKAVLMLCAFLTTSLFVCHGQSGGNDKIIPHSPEAAALGKFINFPVGFNTGVPDISIPLHTVQAGQITLPIEVSYHAGGFAIQEKSTNVGLGWSLSLDLQVTRTVEGIDDFYPNKGYYYNTYLGTFPLSSQSNYNDHSDDVPGLIALLKNHPDDFSNMSNVHDPSPRVKDEQPDRFNFQLLGKKSGTFYFQRLGGASFRVITIPYSDIKIEYNITDKVFNITDTDGTQYEFGAKEEVSDVNPNPDIINNRDPSYIRAWKCTKITSPSKADVVTFTYQAKPLEYFFNINEKIELYDNSCVIGLFDYGDIIYPSRIKKDIVQDLPITAGDVGRYPFLQLSCPKYMVSSSGTDAGLYLVDDNNKTAFYPNYPYFNGAAPITPVYPARKATGLALNQISFRGGQIEFSGTNILGTISISNVNAWPMVKTIDFLGSLLDESCWSTGNETPFGNNYYAKTRYLDQIIINLNKQNQQTYYLDYNDKVCFGSYLKGSDLFGFRNGSTGTLYGNNSKVKVPLQNVEATNIPENTQIGCYSRTLAFSMGAGDITPSDAVKKGVLKRITYPTGGYTEFEFELNQYRDEGINWTIKAGGLRVSKITHAGDPGNNFVKVYKYGENENGGGILKYLNSHDLKFTTQDFDYVPKDSYTQQIAYIKRKGLYEPVPALGYVFLTSGTKKTFLPNSIFDLSFSNGAPVNYMEVAEYRYDEGRASGKSVYKYDKVAYDDFQTTYYTNQTNIKDYESDWYLGQLKSETHYKCTGIDATGKPVYDWVKEKKYDYLKYKIPEQIWVGRVFEHTEYHTPEGTHMIDKDIYRDLGLTISYYPVGIGTGVMLLSKEEEKIKDGNNNILTETTNYQYGGLGKHLQVTQTDKKLSNGNTVTSYVRYPKDYSAAAADIQNLKDNYMLSYPIEQATVVFEPGQTSGKLLSQEKNIYRTDNTGLLEKKYVREDMYNQMVNSSTYQQVTLSDYVMDNSFLLSPKLVFWYDSKGNVATVATKENWNTVYVWAYQKTYPIAKIENATLAEVEAVLDKTAMETFSNLPFPSMDDVRTFLAPLYTDTRLTNAIVNTYTYTPLVGMTSATAPNKVTTYFEYDQTGKLSVIKDMNKDIIKQFQYNYKVLPR